MSSSSLYSIHLPALTQPTDPNSRKTLNNITSRLYEPIRDAEMLTHLGRLRTKLSLSKISNDTSPTKNENKPNGENLNILKPKDSKKKTAKSTSRPVSHSSKSARSATPHRPRSGKSKNSKTTAEDVQTKQADQKTEQDDMTLYSYNSKNFPNNNTPRTKPMSTTKAPDNFNMTKQRSPTSIPELRPQRFVRESTSYAYELNKNNVKNSIRKSTKNRFDNIYKRIDFFSENDFLVNEDYIQTEPAPSIKVLEQSDPISLSKKRRLHPSLRWNLIR